MSSLWSIETVERRAELEYNIGVRLWEYQLHSSFVSAAGSGENPRENVRQIYISLFTNLASGNQRENFVCECYLNNFLKFKLNRIKS